MREVLFRGKCKRNAWSDGGRWLYGDYLRCGDGAQIWVHEDGDENNYEVDPETVGQWTGLTDCKGVRIFEGDVVVNDDPKEAPEPARVVWDPERAAFVAAVPNCEPDTLDGIDWGVVGNVYDNPELLEE